MVYTVNQLITNSLYLSNVVAADLQTATGSQISVGLNLLNSVLASRSVNARHIPYYTIYDFTAVEGQESYFIPNLIEVQTFTFFIQQLRYAMRSVERDQYFGSGRVINIQSLPYEWHIEKVFGGANLYLYFLPDMDYPLQITGKFRLTAVTLGQDLSLTYDQFYIDYLMYDLAERLCSWYKVPFDMETRSVLAEYEKALDGFSPPDLTMTKTSCLQRGNTINWGIVNLSKGFVPPGG